MIYVPTQSATQFRYEQPSHVPMEVTLTCTAGNRATSKKKTGTDCAWMCFVCTNSLSWNHYLGKCPDAGIVCSSSFVDCLYLQVSLFPELIQQTDFCKHCLLVLLPTPLPVIFYLFPHVPKVSLLGQVSCLSPPPLFFFLSSLFLSLLIAEPAVAPAVEAAAWTPHLSHTHACQHAHTQVQTVSVTGRHKKSVFCVLMDQDVRVSLPTRSLAGLRMFFSVSLCVPATFLSCSFAFNYFLSVFSPICLPQYASLPAFATVCFSFVAP